MKWLGLTGGIATGKSTVSKILLDQGLPVVDADQLARKVVEVGTPGFQQVLQVFGPGVVAKDGQLDRRALGLIVFEDTEKLKRLEGIIHPLVQQMMAEERRRFEGQGHEMAFYDVPLLYEKQLESRFDAVIVVAADLDSQKDRIRDRDQLSEEEVHHRISAQIPIQEKVKRADYVIENQGSLADLKMRVTEMVEHFKAL